MIKIKIILEGYLKNKYLVNTIERHYSKPTKINKILKDVEISLSDVFLIKTEDSLIKEDDLIRKSCEVKLFPIIGGG